MKNPIQNVASKMKHKKGSVTGRKIGPTKGKLRGKS